MAARYATCCLLVLARCACAAVIFTGACPALAADAFPRKPVRVVVYTKSGGPIDFTARKFVDIAAKYTDATFVVENKDGAGGIVAMEKVLQLPADGYTIIACTKSNIAKVVSAGREGYLEAFDWIGLLLIDPECVITRADSPLADFGALIANGKSQADDPQAWLGPASGGLDHVMAMRIWDATGIHGKWIPYGSGGQALTDLLGGRGIAYVGNPADATGNPDLKVSVVSSRTPLPQLPGVPTFANFGVPDLDDEYMWRGFALKQGCPPAAKQWYANLFRQVTADPEWRKLWEKDAIQVVYRSAEEFEPIVERDRQQFRTYLERLDMVPLSQLAKQPAWGPWIQTPALVAWLLSMIVVSASLVWKRTWVQYGTRVVLASLMGIGLIFLAQTWLFPPAAIGVGPGAVPQLWVTVLALLVMIAWVRAAPIKSSDEASRALDSAPVASKRGIARVAALLALLVLYVLATIYLGYFVSSLAFLLATMWILGERRWQVLLPVSGAWLLFAYVTFERLLYVHLPTGRLFEL